MTIEFPGVRGRIVCGEGYAPSGRRHTATSQPLRRPGFGSPRRNR